MRQILAGLVLTIALSGCSMKNLRDDFPARTEGLPSVEVVKQLLSDAKIKLNPELVCERLLADRAAKDPQHQIILDKGLDVDVTAKITLGNIYYDYNDKPIHFEVIRIERSLDADDKANEFLEDREIGTGRLLRRLEMVAASWGGYASSSYVNLLP